MKNFIPHVIDAMYLKDYLIRITFDDGQIKVVDFQPYVKRKGVFSLLKDSTFFRSFFIDLNTICWPNGADVAPERLYELGQPVENPSGDKFDNTKTPTLSDYKHGSGVTI